MARQLAGDHLGCERLGTLAGAAEFHDVQPVVIGFHQAGQRPAFTKLRHVAGGRDGPHVASVGRRGRARDGRIVALADRALTRIGP